MTADRPLVIGVADLLRDPGSTREVRREALLPGLATSAAGVPDGAPVVVDLVLEATGGSVVAEGRVEAPWSGACRRCLEPVHDVVHVEVREIFERRPTEGETYRLAGEEVDLEPLARDAVLLALPLAPLCQQGCRGPDPERFPAEPEPEVPADAAGDPRWAALDELRFD